MLFVPLYKQKIFLLKMPPNLWVPKTFVFSTKVMYILHTFLAGAQIFQWSICCCSWYCSQMILVLLTLSAILKTFLQEMTCISEVAWFALWWSGKKHQAHYEKFLPNAIILKATSTPEKAIPLSSSWVMVFKNDVSCRIFLKSHIVSEMKWNWF